MSRKEIDLECVSLIGAGGVNLEKGLSKLFRHYARELRRFFAYHCGNVAEADDLVQETFVKIVASIGSCRNQSSVQSWIWTIARNCLTDSFRYRGSHPTTTLDDQGWEALESSSSALQTGGEYEAKGSVDDCFKQHFSSYAKTHPDCAYALNLQMDGYDIRFIAATLNRTEGATREFLSQCRKKVERYLSPCKELLPA